MTYHRTKKKSTPKKEADSIITKEQFFSDLKKVARRITDDPPARSPGKPEKAK